MTVYAAPRDRGRANSQGDHVDPSLHPSRQLEPAPRLLITAGPTHEPIDAVRFIGNRSSGRLGLALASAAADRGWPVTLALGPATLSCTDTRVQLLRFRTAADLAAILAHETPKCDVLVMAAAVADYRPKLDPEMNAEQSKLRRTEQKLVLELEPTPDLLATVAKSRRPGQLIVGFALEPRERLLASAREKLARKSIDLIVANPLETMNAETIEAHLLSRDGRHDSTPGAIEKTEFALWLLAKIEAHLLRSHAHAVTARPAASPSPQ